MLVSAPAGYGKTVLLAQAAESSRAEWLWIGCSADITTPVCLAELVADAFAEHVPDVDPERVASAADPWTALSAMVRGGWWDDLVVVLDDFERLPASMHLAVRDLVTRSPADARVVLAGRRLPLFALSRLRAEGLVEITASDLAFTVEEATACLSACGREPDLETTAALLNRCEGWPAALRLLAEAPRESTQPAVDYVREEVMERLPKTLVDFIASTAGPKTLGVGEATRLSGRSDAEAILEQLLALQALTFPVRGATLRVRYHGLLRAAVTSHRSRTSVEQCSTVRSAVRIRCLGGLRLRLGNRELSDAALRRPRERTLLAVLICARGPVHREELIELLWPTLPPSPAREALQSCVYRLRKALRPCGTEVAVESDGETYRLTLATPSCCDAFELTGSAPGAIARHDRQKLESLAALADGPFLPEWPYAEWARGLRTDVEETYREILEAIARERTGAGDTSGAISQYRRLLALEPEREGWHRELMRLYAATGERALALRQYESLAERLRAELGVEPCLETRELHRSLLVGTSSGAAGT